MKYSFFTTSLFFFFTINITYSQGLPTESSNLFSGSGNCETCHYSDGFALTYNEVDVSMVTYWRSTMMANSSKDPLWRAYVAEEVEEFPALQEFIESKCLKCHSPLGYTEAIYNGQSGYSMEELKQDPLANDGVSCTACHQIQPDNFGTKESYSGGYIITDERTIYGPYANPDTIYMQSFVNYTPKLGEHINQSELCATCHTLFTPTVNSSGEIVGDFPEQTPYIEWKNSIYPLLDMPCQSCHMPKIYDPIDIAAIPSADTVYRSPFWRHNFVGGNVMVLNVLKDNPDSLHVTAWQEHFDSTIYRTEINLKESSVDLEMNTAFINDSMELSLKLINKAGHKLPSGIPLRRMWVHLVVKDNFNNIVFESGNWNSDGSIIGMNSDYEPHYNKITKEDEVQIYEGVLEDLDGNVTYALLKAAAYKKDNRIPPKGFTSSYISYDTTAIVGSALNDDNFNIENGTEGSGSDVIYYKIPASENQQLTAVAEICYQTLKSEAADHLGNYGSGDVVSFLSMYSAADKTPVIMKKDSLNILVTSAEVEELINVNSFVLKQNYPNPFNPGTVISWQSPVSGRQTLKVYDILGKEIATLVDEYRPAGNYNFEFDAGSLPSGIYFYTFTAGNFKQTRKMALLR